MTNGYPKWVQRAPHIGAVLCINAREEKVLLDEWEAQQDAAERALHDADAVEAALRDAEVLAQADAIRTKSKGK